MFFMLNSLRRSGSNGTPVAMSNRSLFQNTFFIERIQSSLEMELILRLGQYGGIFSVLT
jgi:hypothetical protein